MSPSSHSSQQASPWSSTIMDRCEAEKLMREATELVEKADMVQRLFFEENDVGDGQTAENDHFYEQTQAIYTQALHLQEWVVGYRHEDTAKTYHEMGLLAAKMKKHQRALGYLLQSLRISHYLYGADHPITIVVTNDVQDLLVDEMKLDIRYANSIFESWALQDEAEDLLAREGEETSASIQLTSETGNKALLLYRQAMNLLPKEAGLERAHLCCQIAAVLASGRYTEESLSWYCQALVLFSSSGYLSADHPKVTETRQKSSLVAKGITPIYKVDRVVYSPVKQVRQTGTRRSHFSAGSDGFSAPESPTRSKDCSDDNARPLLRRQKSTTKSSTNSSKLILQARE